jgi:(1->4)-alpha-D-glucan 1-alpha-D-glucosylmutase
MGRDDDGVFPDRLDLAPRIPLSTYRLQFNRTFTFEDARGLVDYLDALGISDLYASPYLAARPGSLHGYDLIDHNALNPELGSPEDYDRLVAALHERGMGQILDVVPNHMGIAGGANQWWNDVLENGPGSPYAEFFDVDWEPLKRELADKVLLPILGDQYGRVLENQELTLQFEEGPSGSAITTPGSPWRPAPSRWSCATDWMHWPRRSGSRTPTFRSI